MIDIYILAEELPAIAMPAEDRSAKRLNLASVRLFTPEEDAFETDCLYLLDVADANRAEGLGPDATFCLCRPIAPGDVRITSDCLLVQDGAPIPVVLNRVQRVFDRYDRIERETTEAALGGADIAEVLKAGAAVLANPVALFDSTSILMAQAALGTGEARDAIWDDVLPEAKGENLADAVRSISTGRPKMCDADALHRPGKCSVQFPLAPTRASPPPRGPSARSRG